MLWLRNFFGFMLIEALLLGTLASFFAEPWQEHFIRTSPWMFLYYAPFAAIAAHAIPRKGGL